MHSGNCRAALLEVAKAAGLVDAGADKLSGGFSPKLR